MKNPHKISFYRKAQTSNLPILFRIRFIVRISADIEPASVNKLIYIVFVDQCRYVVRYREVQWLLTIQPITNESFIWLYADRSQ